MREYIAAVFILFSIGMSGAAEAAKKIRFIVSDRCNDATEVDYRFFDTANNKLWPSSEEFFYTRKYKKPYLSVLRCDRGAYVCYGASSGDKYWGVGLNNEQGCTDCCYSCRGQVVRLKLVCGANTSGNSTPVPTNSLTVKLKDQCGDGYRVDYRFFDVNNNLVWPASDRNYYTLAFNQYYRHDLACAPGAQVCYGASSGSLYWGVGLDGNNGCEDCCAYCNGGTLTANLACGGVQ